MPIVKFSAKSHYGVRLLTHLAKAGRNIPVALSDVVKKERISRAYLEELAVMLKKKKIVGSKKGRGGGYFLLQNPKTLTAKKIVEALEGPLMSVGCVTGDGRCATEKDCCSKTFWRRVKKDIDKSLERITMEDIIAGNNKKIEKGKKKK